MDKFSLIHPLLISTNSFINKHHIRVVRFISEFVNKLITRENEG